MSTDNYACTDQSFMRMVAYFWSEKGDPTRFIHWDEERCKRLMPEFLRAWKKLCKHSATLHRLAQEHAE